MMKYVSTLLIVAIASMPSARADIESCQLVDHQEYKELSAAVNQLGQTLEPNMNCKQADLREMMAAQEQLRQNSQQLMSFMSNPEGVSDVAIISATLSEAVYNVDSISSTLSNSSFLKSECGKSMMTSGKIIKGLSEISMSLTPIALAIGAMTGGTKIAIPVALGVSGLYSALKILGGLTSTSTFDINNYDHRQLILRSTCEYSRVNQRVRYMMLMQSGDFRGLRGEMNKRSQALEVALAARPNLKTLVNQYRAQLVKVNERYREIRDAKKTLGQWKSQLGRYAADKTRMCALAQIQAKKDVTQNVLTLSTTLLARTVNDFPPSVALLDEAQAANSVQKVVEQRAKEILLVEELPDRTDDCVDTTTAWMDSSAETLRVSERILREREEKLKAAMNREPEYRKWASQVASVENDRALLEKLLPMMQTRTEPGSAISRADLIERERDIRRILLGTKGFRIPFMGARSLAGQWLEHSLARYRDASRTFMKGYAALDKETHTEIDDVVIVNSGDPMAPMPVIIVPQDNLKLLTLKRFPKNTRGWRNACRRLDDLHLHWLRAQDHLNATRFYCRTIDPLIGEDVEPSVVSTCKGGLALVGAKKTPVLTPVTQSPQKEATLVQAKRTEMQCPMMKAPAGA